MDHLINQFKYDNKIKKNRNIYQFILMLAIFIFLIIDLNNHLISASSLSRSKRLPESNPKWREYRKNKSNPNNSTSSNVNSSAIIININTTTTLAVLSSSEQIQNRILNKESEQNEKETISDSNSSNKTIITQTNQNTNEQKEPANTNQSGDDDGTSTRTSRVSNFFNSIIKKFDRYTLIMTTAFFAGILLIVILVLLSVCVCKSINRLNRRKRSNSLTLDYNPAYDPIMQKPNGSLGGSNGSLPSKTKIYLGDNEFGSPRSKHSSSETKELIDKKDIELRDLNKDKEKQKGLNISIQTAESLTSSTSSMDSFVLKSPNTPNSKTNKENNQNVPSNTPLTNNPNSNLKSSLTNLTQKLSRESSEHAERSHLLSDDNDTNSDYTDASQNKSTANRFQVNTKGKAQQRSNKDLHSSNPRLSLLMNFGRTKSESADDQAVSQLPPLPPNSGLSKRISVASSNSSIVQTTNQSIDFTQIQTGVDDLINDINQNKSNKSSTNNIDNPSSLHESLSDIYLQAIKEKREMEKLSKSAKSSNYKPDPNKRRSINLNNTSISTDPNGNTYQNANNSNKSNLLNNDSVSVNTLESEKSCY